MSTKGLAFIDRYSVAILRLLASDPMRSYYQREVARNAGVSVGKTNQVLRALEREEVVTREHMGKVDLYRYNLADPASRYLKIFFNLSEASQLLRILRSVSKKVILFGSCAEGTDAKDSDMDVLIVASDKEAAERTFRRAGRLITGRSIYPVILSQLEFSELKEKDPSFYEQVSKGITLWQNGRITDFCLISSIDNRVPYHYVNPNPNVPKPIAKDK